MSLRATVEVKVIHAGVACLGLAHTTCRRMGVATCICMGIATVYVWV